MTTEANHTHGKASTMTHKQGALLFRFTGLKFWEPQNAPAPTIAQASELVGLCMEWSRARKNPAEQARLKTAIVALARQWFPDWNGDTLANRWGGRKKSAGPSSGSGATPSDEPERPTAKHEAHEDEPEEPAEIPADEETAGAKAMEAPAADEYEATTGDKTLDAIVSLLGAGLQNLWLHGPAGTGKTTLCKMAAEAMGLPCTILSCSAGTSPAEIVGFKYPEPRPSPVSRAIGQPGIVVLDEVTMLDPAVAAVANALLANGEIETSTGHVVRRCYIIATSNTTGTGADRQYIGNNQLDAATLNRFAGGFVEVNYSADYEAQFAPDVVKFCQRLRSAIATHNLRRIVSTRDVIAGHKLKAAGLDWKSAILAPWSETDRATAGV